MQQPCFHVPAGELDLVEDLVCVWAAAGLVGAGGRDEPLAAARGFAKAQFLIMRELIKIPG